MRMKLTFKSDRALKLPIHYSEKLIGFIYSNIKDEQYKRFLHEAGYPYHGGRTYKHFSYSRLLGSYKVDKVTKSISFTSSFSLVIASPLDRFVQEIANALLSNKTLRLGNYALELERFEVMSAGQVSSPTHIKMLSPLVIYSTLTHPNGLKHTYYYKPDHEKFSSMLEANLKRKYLSLYPEDADIKDAPFTIRPIRVGPKHKVITRFKGTLIEGWMGEYEVGGDARLLELAHHSNLGSKGQLGFGLFEIVT